MKETFSSEKQNTELIQEKINKLDTKKMAAEEDIPAKILVKSNDIIAYHLKKMYNDSIDSCAFLRGLKKDLN